MSKRKTKIISLLLSLILIISIINFKNLNVMADVPDKPDFDVHIDNVAPNPALLGEDITIKGTITPKPFETAASPKEIVLVLDVSGSMNEEVTVSNELCTEPRDRYWVPGRWEGRSYVPGHYVYDYCSKHSSVGEHYTGIKSTRIAELKKAANNFIDKMKNEKGLKIGIVSYSSIADFNPIQKLGEKRIYAHGFGYHNVSDYKSHSNTFLNANDSKLYDIINTLNPLGGTNIGEGMRKAIYMLEKGTPSANKTIVLMTDGEPTFYSVHNSNLGKYMAIDNETPEIAGQGSGLDSKALDYASDIGKIIKDKGYNSFSIGYGMTERGNEALEKIHSSMIGTEWNDNIELTEEDGFFKTSDGAIDSVFQKIATEIINSYPVNNVDLNMEFNEGFTLNIGGNTVNIGNINYKKVSDVQGSDKIRYEADPVPFEFTIKGGSEGIYLVFNNLNLSYKWDNQTKTKPIDENVEITINPNELPNISARLLSSDDVLVKPNEEIALRYEVNPTSFEFTDMSNGSSNDVAIVIDTSMDMKEEISIIRNAIFNKLLSNDTLKNTKTHYSLITFSNKSNIETDLFNNKNKDYYKDYNKYITDLNDQYLKNINAEQQSSNAKKIGDAFPNVINVLNNGREDTGKTFVIIGNENTSYNQKDIEEIKSKGYNVITLSVDNNKKGDLYNLHKDLNGKEENYFYIQDANNIENSVMGKVAEILISGIRLNGYEFNPVINLNLSGNFDAVSGIEKVENNIATIKVPKIVYKYDSTSGLYKSESFQVEFTIRAKSGKFGELGFGKANDNKLVYKKLVFNNDNDKYKYSIINTPKVTVKPQVKNLIHGLYNGIEENDLKIDTSMAESGFSIAANSTVTYGASFILTGREVNFNLNLDSKFSKISSSEIKAYIVESGRLVGEGVSIQSTSNSNEFKLSINDSKSLSEERQVVLIYKRKITEVQGEGSKDFTNEIIIEGLNSAVKVKVYKPNTDKPKLPDLF